MAGVGSSPSADFLTRQGLGRLLEEIPPAHKPLFLLLASTGLRISEAIVLRWCDLDLDSRPPRLRVQRAIVNGVLGAPKSRHGARTLPLSVELTERLRALRVPSASAEELAFANGRGRPIKPDNFSYGDRTQARNSGRRVDRDSD